MDQIRRLGFQTALGGRAVRGGPDRKRKRRPAPCRRRPTRALQDAVTLELATADLFRIQF